ncbi:MAG: GNAT family N-acetyltransferase [Chloroflexota bacterium]
MAARRWPFQSLDPTDPTAAGRRAGADGSAGAARVRRVADRLPQPVRRAPPRKEIVLRTATAADAIRCATLNASYATSHIWQLDTRQEGDEVRTCFRLVRLPRELTLVAEHRPPALPNGAVRRGVLWVVAEEVEVTDEANAGDGRNPPWNHAMRYTGGASAVQLSLPATTDTFRPTTDGRSSAEGEPTPAPRSGQALGAAEGSPANGRSSVAGYVVAAAPRDEYAYLQALVVDKAYRRQGIAGRLLAEACRWAANQGASQLMADVPARSYPALRLLQKSGFAFCGFNDRCYPSNEVAVFFSVDLR